MKFIIFVVLLFLTSCSSQYEISFIGEDSFDLENALKQTEIDGKPLLIYFNAIGCINCRKIEKRILANNEVRKIINENYNFITLITDDLSEIKNIEGKRDFNNEIIKTNMHLNVDYQVRLTKSGSQPIFAILLDDRPTKRTIGYSEDINDLIQFLK